MINYCIRFHTYNHSKWIINMVMCMHGNLNIFIQITCLKSSPTLTKIISSAFQEASHLFTYYIERQLWLKLLIILSKTQSINRLRGRRNEVWGEVKRNHTTNRRRSRGHIGIYHVILMEGQPLSSRTIYIVTWFLLSRHQIETLSLVMTVSVWQW